MVRYWVGRIAWPARASFRSDSGGHWRRLVSHFMVLLYNNIRGRGDACWKVWNNFKQSLINRLTKGGSSIIVTCRYTDRLNTVDGDYLTDRGDWGNFLLDSLLLTSYNTCLPTKWSAVFSVLWKINNTCHAIKESHAHSFMGGNFFCLKVPVIPCSSNKGVFLRGCFSLIKSIKEDLKYTESLILAQNERWRRV